MALTKVSTDGVKDDAITKTKIPANQIEASELADNAVDTAAIADNAVTMAKLAGSSVITANIVNGNITTAKIADQAVTLAKLPHGTSSNDGKFLRANNGADPSFETITGTTINNNADNRVITGSGTANTLNGESNVVIDANGKLGIGTTPATILHVKANLGDMLRLDRDNAGAVGNQLAFRHKDGSGNFVETASINCVSAANADGGVLTFSTKTSGGSNTERMRLRTATGALMINSDGSDRIGEPRLHVTQGGASTNVASFFYNTTHDRDAIIIRHNGADGGNNRIMIGLANADGNKVGNIISNGSSTSYNTSSDYRLKENVTAISDGITRLKTLKPYKFNFKADASTTVDGFFAHEVTAVPEAISGTKDEVDSDNNPVYQGIDQSKLVPLLTAALQEAVAKIEVLETKVAALEAA